MAIIDRGQVMFNYLEILGNRDSYKAKFEALCKAIDDAPALDYAPVRYGEWLEDIREDKNQVNRQGLAVVKKWGYKCSLCGRKEKTKHEYCHCGALMEGGQIGE